MKYYKEIKTTEGVILSIDKLVIDYYISDHRNRSALALALDTLEIRYAVTVTHWSSLRIGSFRENFTVAFQDRSSFWIGIGLNAHKPNFGRVRLEFNPNKCATHQAFLYLLGVINEGCRRMHTIIKRFDLAIDLSVERADTRLVKDRRDYSEIRKSQSDYTQYLGAKSSTVGRVKLYNKTIEAGLPYPLTRLELTLDPTTPYEKISWPKAYIIRTRQSNISELHLTDTERFILGALLDGYGSLADLGRKTRAKMETLLSQYVQWVKISEKEYSLILSNLQGFLNYLPGVSPLNAIDLDQPPMPTPTWMWDT